MASPGKKLRPMHHGHLWARILGICAVLGAASPGWGQAAPATPASAAPAASPADKSAVLGRGTSRPVSPATQSGSAPDAKRPADTSADLPKFRAGVWEYTRTISAARGRVAPQTTTVRKCSDPSREFEEKMASLKRRGCRFSPLVRQGDEYHSNWNCPGTDGLVIFDDVLTAANELSYQDRSEIRYVPQSSRTSTLTITAKWLSSCPIVGRPTPLH